MDEPKRCLNCGKEIYGDRRKKFCNNSCSATYNNKLRANYKGLFNIRQDELKEAESKVDKTIVVEKREITRNGKNVGERGEKIAIGELAKFDVDVMLPMGDNLPFDLVVYYNGKFFKCQVKTSTMKTKNGSIAFSLRTNNWYSKKIHHYTNDEVDVFILCDLTNIYLLRFDEIKNKANFAIRNSVPKNKNLNGINFASDYIISKERIEKVFN